MQRIGLIGFGKMGVLHAGIINTFPACRVTAICESQKFIVRMAKKLLHEVSFYENVSDMIDGEQIDAVYVTSPIHSHARVIREILQSRKDIGLFSEKPLAANASDAHEVANAVKGGSIINMVGFHKRCSPIIKRGKEFLDRGAIGDPRSFNGYTYSSDVLQGGRGWRFERTAGGALLDLGSHLLDMLLWYFGEPECTSSTERSIYSADVEDYVHSEIMFRSGLKGTIDVSWSQAGYRLPEIRLEVRGTNGWLVVSDDYVSVQADSEVKEVVAPGRRTFRKPDFSTNVNFLLAEPEYTMEDEIFLKATQDKSQVEPSFQTASKVNDLIDLIHKDAQRQMPL